MSAVVQIEYTFTLTMTGFGFDTTLETVVGFDPNEGVQITERRSVTAAEATQLLVDARNRGDTNFSPYGNLEFNTPYSSRIIKNYDTDLVEFVYSLPLSENTCEIGPIRCGFAGAGISPRISDPLDGFSWTSYSTGFLLGNTLAVYIMDSQLPLNLKESTLEDWAIGSQYLYISDGSVDFSVENYTARYVDPAPVPLPAPVLFLLTGAAGFLALRRSHGS